MSMCNQVLEGIWSGLEPVDRFVSVVGIDGHVYRQLDAAGRDYLAQKLMTRTKEDVVFCRDGSGGDRYLLGPPRFLAGRGMLLQHDSGSVIWVSRPADEAVAVPDRVERIPRPPNAYIIYRTEHHRAVKAAHPEMTNSQISVHLGKAWQKLSVAEREEYKRKSAEARDELLAKYPDYKYKPRKAGEKKRRKVTRSASGTVAGNGLSGTVAGNGSVGFASPSLGGSNSSVDGTDTA